MIDAVFRRLLDHTILDVRQHTELGGNINGPSLIRVPEWVPDRLARYYLYFAHHEGRTIRLALADQLSGPWRVYEPGAMNLAESLFCQHPPAACDTHPDVLVEIAAGREGDYPHIASPDVHIDNQHRKILMYYHGRNPDGTQQTRLAVSDDGTRFTALPALLGDPYFRVFPHMQFHYAIAWGSVLYRSTDGGFNFERGVRLTDDNYRHGAILSFNGSVYVIWSRAGDCPESLLISMLDDAAGSDGWRRWRLVDTQVLHRPERSWEGVDEPLRASTYGGCMESVHEVRDPCIFREDGQTYLLYSVRGEQGIAIAQLDLTG